MPEAKEGQPNSGTPPDIEPQKKFWPGRLCDARSVKQSGAGDGEQEDGGDVSP